MGREIKAGRVFSVEKKKNEYWDYEYGEQKYGTLDLLGWMVLYALLGALYGALFSVPVVVACLIHWGFLHLIIFFAGG